jgi:hypothetical protein
MDDHFFKNNKCVICAQKYNLNETICSCCKKNSLKHNFHKECIKMVFKHNANNDSWYINSKKKECPYCRKEIKRLFYIQKKK